MIQYFESSKGVLKQLDYNSIEDESQIDLNDKWINMLNPDDKEIELISRLTGVQEDMIKAALDEEESSRIENEDGVLMALFDIPTTEDKDDYYTYSTLPFAYIRTRNTVITVCLAEHTSIINDFITGRAKGVSVAKRTRFLLQLMYKNSVKFLQYLRQIDKTSKRVQGELHKSMKNKELIQLLELENSLVYFSTALRSNQILLDKFEKIDRPNFYEEDEDLLEDVRIENRQALEMCNIYSDILSGTMDAFASVISNNLNIVMKLLAAITILIAIPSMIAAFWGMNTGVPWEGNVWGFWIVIGISAVICIVTAFLLWRKNMLK
ncbi:MAG: magnesium transporter CorA family protein [Clostridiaceae bacterium]|jgi:magnesium transporter|nr:magnesium transporter CorA family protein [Clostridiaceae bacterium]